MRRMSISRRIFFAVLVLGGFAVQGAESSMIRGEISDLLNDIAIKVSAGQYNSDDLLVVRDRLVGILEFSNQSAADIICLRSSNGRYYPFDPNRKQFVGDSDYSAGHLDNSSCRETLVSTGYRQTCYKYGNGLFFPANAATGEVLGGSAYSAGHSNLESCKATLVKSNQRFTCYKSDNGRYYHSYAESGEVFGSSDHSAGYSNYVTCAKELP